MRSHNTTTRSIALALTVLLTVCNLPLMAADKTPASIGSISSAGSVQLRGVALNNDGTLFSGDRLNVGPGSYARVTASTGQKLEIGANSDVVVSREGDNTSLQMASGNVAFKGTGKGATRVHIGVYDVVTSPDAAGNVAFVGGETFGVHLTSGTATVRNTQTKQSFVVQKGSERLVSLTTGTNYASLGQLASSVPTLPPPALPRRQASGMSTSTWISIVAAAAGGATLVTYFLAREDGDERGAQIKALTDLNSILSTSSATASVSAQASSVAGQAAAAISASSLSAAAKASLQSQVTAVTTSANNAAAKINVLIPKIQALQQQIASQEKGPTTDQSNQLKQLNADLNSARTDLANAINQLNALLASATAQGVPGLPTNPNLQVPPPANVASASVPA